MSAPDDVRLIAREAIDPNPHQHRKHFDDEALADLARSLAAQGILQNLVVRPHPEAEGRFQLIAGERRWRAAALAGLDELPCRVIALSDADAAKFALVENVQRENISPLEEADGYEVLRERFCMAADDIAAEIGKGASYVSGRLALVALGQNARDLLEQGLLGVGQAQEIAKVLDPNEQFRLAKIAVEKQMGRGQTATLVRAYLEGGPQEAKQMGMALDVPALTDEEQAHRTRFLSALDKITDLLHGAWDTKQQVIARKVLVSALRADLEKAQNLGRWLGEVAQAIEQEVIRREVAA